MLRARSIINWQNKMCQAHKPPAKVFLFTEWLAVVLRDAESHQTVLLCSYIDVIYTVWVLTNRLIFSLWHGSD